MTTSRSLSSVLLEIGLAMDSLLDLSSKKTGTLTSGDVVGLERLLSVEQDLIQRLGFLETERASCSEDTASAVNAEALDLRESLKEKAKRISEINARNQSLLRQGLNIVKYELRLFLPQGKYGSALALGPLVFDHRV